MFTLNDLLLFGKDKNGTVEITESFAVKSVENEKCESFGFMVSSFYVGKEAPHVYFSLTLDGQAQPLYQSHFYIVGKPGEFIEQYWRMPPMFEEKMTFSVNVDIPKGTVLYIRDFGKVDAKLTCKKALTRHNAHLGFWGMAPDNTMPAFELAAESGFVSCIAVPKVTKDGVIVCIHDDTINRTARDSDGNAPAEPVKVSDMTYEELLKWEYGSYKNEIYKGTRIPKLTEFFDLCQMSGMSPMFSTHPGLTYEQWSQVKTETDRRGLTGRFHIKGFGVDILKTAVSVFGTEVDGYTHDSRNFCEDELSGFLSLGVDNTKCRLGFEIPLGKYTEEIGKKIIDKGLFAAAYGIRQRSSEDYRRLISYGVTEFTEDLHCTVGFEW